MTSPATHATRPTLTTEQWQRVFALYDGGALDANESPEICAALSHLRDTQLRSAPETREFGAVAALAFGVAEPATGGLVGRYRLLAPIAQGGMGSVWRAERNDGLYSQTVAIKLLGSLALSQQARARFIREGELLAKLNHPNIARLLDVGLTEDGQRFLSIELIEGVDIAAHCREKPLNEKLSVFRQLLSAVAYSHSQLVLHRDIKPANVLVDRAGQVKLLDFGVAKLADDDAVDEGLTRSMGRALTERYAAPEQFLDDSVGTTADVFALGSLLVELLSGEKIEWSHPKNEWVNSALDISLRTSLANMPEDLRAIATKATSREPSERYTSVSEFDDDVARFLASEPVRARPASAWYRFAKFVRRHRGSFGAGVAAALAVIVSLVFALIQLLEAREQQAIAKKEAARATAVNAYLTDLFEASDMRLPSGADRSKFTAKDLLDAGAKRLETALSDQPETKIALLGTLSEIYAHTENQARADELIEQRVKVATAAFGPNHPSIHDSMMLSAWSAIFAGKHQLAREKLDALERHVQAHPIANDGDVERRANRMHLRARIERWANALPIEQVSVLYRNALDEYEKANQGRASEHHAALLSNYAVVLNSTKREAEALAAIDQSIAMLEKLPARKLKDFANLGNTYSLRAQLAGRLEKHDEARQSFDKALEIYRRSPSGDTHPAAVAIRLYRAHQLHRVNRRDEAWQEAAVVRPFYANATVPPTAVFEWQYIAGQMFLAEQRKADAITMFEQAIAGWRASGNNPRRLKDSERLLAKARELP